MTEVLRGIRREAAGLPYEVTFEATHHGPLLEAPAFFIEAGSTEREWGDRAAAEALMRALLSATPSSSPVAVGVGGGHYVPRLTDVALSRDVAFGHLLAGHALPFLTDAMIDQVVARTPGASLVYFHRKALETRTLRDLLARFEARGLRAVREEDLAPLPPKQSY
jgi:D-aminoacyl-tRNA deacylase